MCLYTYMGDMVDMVTFNEDFEMTQENMELSKDQDV